ncbi:MAG: PQQ-dependent sugar dehydrogenase [Pyrinomonadaceae bacterium]
MSKIEIKFIQKFYFANLRQSRDKILLSIVFLLSFLSSSTFAQVKLVPHKVSLKNGKTFNLNLPANYEIIPAAENLNRVRFFAKSPDGRIFVTDMFDMSDNRKGTVYILDTFDAKTGKFGKIIPFMRNLRNPNSVAFYTDKRGQDWFYLAETDKLTRYKFIRKSVAPTGTPQVLATFPDYGLNYKHGSWHMTRTIAFSPTGKLYISIGTSCDSCTEKKKEKDIRGVVLEMNADGGERRVYARNIKNAVGLKWIGNKPFATNEGVDHLGLDKPDDTFYELKEGANYGWSQCFQADGKVAVDPKYVKKKKPLPDCSFVPTAYAYFPAHSSALGFDFFDAKTSDKNLRNSFLVALHGSTDRNWARGYKIIAVREGNRHQDFITGFVQGINIFGRPCDIMKLSPDSFLFSDDRGGVIYYVRKKAVNRKRRKAASPEF